MPQVASLSRRQDIDRVVKMFSRAGKIAGVCFFLFQAFAPASWGNDRTSDDRVKRFCAAMGQLGLTVADMPGIKKLPFYNILGESHLQFRESAMPDDIKRFIKVS